MTFSHRISGISKAALTATLMALSAAPALAQSLPDTIATALENNPSVAAARADVAATEETVTQARANLRPQVDANASYQRRDLTREQSFDSLTGTTNRTALDLDTVDVGVEASQTLFEGFSNRYRINAATFDVDAARARLDQEAQTVIFDAVTAHADVFRDELIAALRSDSARALGEQVSGAKRRRELNDATITDVAQAEARLAGAEADLQTARAELRASRSRYESAVGVAAQTPGALLPIALIPQTLDEAYEIAATNAPSLEAARARARASEEDVSAARGAFAPRVSAFASAGYGEEQNFAGDSREELIVGLRARVPIYQGGATSSQVRQARSLAERDQFLILQAERDLRADVASQFERYKASEQVIAALQAQVDASARAFDSIQREALGGVRTLTDVLDAERDLIGARVRLAQAERDAYVASWGLLSVIGQARADALVAG